MIRLGRGRWSVDGFRVMALGQGGAFVGLGAWPLLSMRTFELVTGPKKEDWLVRTVGGLTVAIGLGLLAGSRQPRVVRPLGVASAATFMAADIIGVASGRLRPVYLLDAVGESAIIAGWAGLTALEVARRAGSTRRSGVGGRERDERHRRGRRPADAEVMRSHVAALLEEARDVAERTWPGEEAPAPVRDSLRRLTRAVERLEAASQRGSREVMRADEQRRLEKLVAAADVEAASVKEAAYLVSS